MTVAAVEAEALGELLAKLPDPAVAAWEPRFQKQLERLLFIPWLMSTMEDMRNRKFANPNLSARTLHGYIDLMLRGAVTDPTLHVAFLRVMHMMRSPFSLMAPGALAHVVARGTRRALGPPPPAVHAALVEPQRRTPDTSLLAPVAPLRPVPAD